MDRGIRMITAVAVGAAMLSLSCEGLCETAHTEPKKLADYLYYIEYADYVPLLETEAAMPEITGGCSVVRNGDLFGRNLDLSYCDTPEFVVRMGAEEGRFASIGVCANPMITSVVEEMTEDELMRMPNITNDGVNENGVAVSVNVVISGDLDDQRGTNPEKTKISGMYVVRYVLDHAKSAAHAIELLEGMDIVGGFAEYGLHWMIADETDTYVVEVIGDRLAVSRNEHPIMTNFYLNLGPVQSEQTAAGKTYKDLPLLNDHAIGIERYCALREGYEQSASVEGMAALLERVRATAAYDLTAEDPWYTEFTAENLPIDSGREDYAKEFARQYELYRNRDRSDPKGDWITWHTSVYDLANRTLALWSQEEYGTGFEFAVEK